MPCVFPTTRIIWLMQLHLRPRRRYPHAMNPSNGSSLLTPESSSTLRPRTRRLISVEDDIYATDESEGGLSRNASRKGSRNGSPTPASSSGNIASSSRLSTVSNPISSFETSTSPRGSRSSRSKSKGLSGIWGNPWSAIQGMAANVIGGDGAPTDATSRSGRPQYGRRTSASAPPPKQWGPAGADSHVGAGTQEEREAMVRAMKRKDLLTGNEQLMTDSIGRIKRRNSDDRMSTSAPPCENDDRDALVYVHHVQLHETLAGLSIKYNCEQTVLRKSNRMWPNDSVQTKKIIVLPVDACGIKGRPVQGPEALPDEDLLLGEFSASSNKTAPEETNGLPNGWNAPKQKDRQPGPLLSTRIDPETPWKHDSWVLLPNDKQPTQIGRMPRRALGFFPPARRKSLAYSDASTPRASVDLTGSSTSTNPNPSSPRPTRSRASSNLSSVSGAHHQRSASGKWGLHGPGGVGTLGRNVRVPGPAQDGLNKNFAQYLPSVAPPPGQEYFTPWAPSLLDAGNGTSSQRGGSGAITPIHGAGMDLQDIGGAIEGWVRKVGNQAQKLLTEPNAPGQGKRSAVPVLGSVGGDLGDLIELQDDPFEIGDDEHDRGRARTNEIMASTNEPSTSRSAQQYQSARPDINLVLRDRGRKGEGSKKD